MEIRHAREINEAKLQFFINISHEIRTPMTLIINPLEKLIAANKDKETGKTYMMIYRNAKRILRLINQLMDIRKIEKGQMQMHFRETDMVGFINDLMMTFDNTARQKKIDFSFNHKDSSLMGWIDINNFDKVLMNLLSNAFKYTPDNGKVQVTLKYGEDQSVKGPLKNYIEIKVTDTGIGIDENQKDRIFERFLTIEMEERLLAVLSNGFHMVSPAFIIVSGPVVYFRSETLSSVPYGNNAWSALPRPLVIPPRLQRNVQMSPEEGIVRKKSSIPYTSSMVYHSSPSFTAKVPLASFLILSASICA